MTKSGWHRKDSTSPAALARAREYRSPEHKQLRAHYKQQVDAGQAICCRCHRPIAPGAAFHLDHNDTRTGYLGPAHARCNLKAAASKGARIANAKRKPSRTGVTALPM